MNPQMQMDIHAHNIARLCTQPYAQLVLQVTAQHPDSDVLQRELISMLSHASQMSRICSAAESQEMIYTVAEKLFEAASTFVWSSQHQAVREIIGMISHASAMARIVRGGADEIYGAVRPIVEDNLPMTTIEMDHLSERLETARRQISDISHRKQMERLIGATLQ
jgi:hypothetical protein